VRILIADDDPVSRRLLEATLVRLGHEVIAVADGHQAQDELLRHGGPRLAILDWVMPKADGLEVCKAIRKRSATYVYVILLTTRDKREDMVEALDAEADDFLTKPFDVVELGARLRSGERVLGLQEELIKAHEALHHEAMHDRLTTLWNRGRILDQLGRELIRARREHRPLAVAIADIDNFKQINDTQGHQAGDDVLRQVAERMSALRGERDCIGRYGGEEFLIVLPGCDLNAARGMAERLRLAVSTDPIHSGDFSLNVSVSFGIAATDRCDEQPAVLIHAADEGLYRAKAFGRNRVEAAPTAVR
jgi:two-component system cell cycle response regulator